MSMNPPKYIIFSLIISTVVTIAGILLYDSLKGKRVIIVENRKDAVNISNHSYSTNDRNIFPDNFNDIIVKSRKSVVFVQAVVRNQANELQYNTGSGFFVLPTGEIVTNAHVIHNAEMIKVSDDENREYEAEVIAIDESSDLAVIKVKGENFSVVFFGESDRARVGDWVVVIGSPFKLKNSVSVGIISALHRNLGLRSSTGIESYIQSDALTSPGNSGGVMLDDRGKLLGVISANISDDNTERGFSFAIPSGIVKKVVFDLINYGMVRRAWAGLTAVDNKGGKGVLVERLESEGAAYKAGIATGDIIEKVDGLNLENAAHLTEAIAIHKPGDTVVFMVKRNGTMQKIPVILQNSLHTTDMVFHRKDESFYRFGFVLRDLTGKEKKGNEAGAYVVSIKKGSQASKINMEPGFFITSVNDYKIVDVDDLVRQLKSIKGKIELKGYYQSYPGKFKYVLQR